MTDNTLPPAAFPAVCAKKITAAFDGGRITSDGGFMLLAVTERLPGSGSGRSVAVEPCRALETVTLDIDETVDVVHGHQQLSLFNTHSCRSTSITPPPAGPAP